jgi:NADH-quinone oxidoreductase subunit A
MELFDYAFVGFFLIFGAGFALAAFVASWILRPHHPNPVKLSAYECGEISVGPSWVQFNVRYYLFALIFLVFDVEAVFIVPWAVVFRRLGWSAYFEMIVFILILVVGLIYAWKKGVLEWL